MSKWKKSTTPIIVDAFLWTGNEKQEEDPEWICEAIAKGIVKLANVGTPQVKMLIPNWSRDKFANVGAYTTETVLLDYNRAHIANLGDYIIRTNDGKIYACDPDLFETMFSIVSSCRR